MGDCISIEREALMQTFMPEHTYIQSAKRLDNKRLGKQRIEVWQIYNSLSNPDYGWKNHPAVLMWKGYEIGLLFYGIAICFEWRRRGFKDTLLEKFRLALKLDKRTNTAVYPPWMVNKKLITSHRSNLLRKNPTHYRQFWPKLTDKLPYYWPTKDPKYVSKHASK